MNILLKGGMIIDGTGGAAKKADVLMQSGVLKLSPSADELKMAAVIDCQGKIIAPGFIDVHSHMDYFAIGENPEDFDSFLAQGITTMVVGNCGFSPFGFKCHTKHQHLIENSLFKEGHGEINWNQFSDYQKRIKTEDCRPNLLSLAGHGVCRTSLNGFSAEPLSKEQHQEMLGLLDEALSQGAAGVSLGLQYKPGVFAQMAELRDVARLVKRHNKILTVHAKAYSILSGTYPMNPFGKAHNLRAIDDMLDLARETGVRLQFSHLIFVGEKSWSTVNKALKKFDLAIADGVDVKFDMFPYPFGASLLNTLLPERVMADMPEVLQKKIPMARLRLEFFWGFKAVGAGYDCLQISDACCKEYEQYNGLLISEIAKAVNQPAFDVMVDILYKSNAEARIIFHKYYNEEIIEKLIQHPASLFMTDAWPEPSGVDNAACFGAFPRFIELARDKGLLSREEVISRMTQQAADRFGLKNYGVIQDDAIADIVVLDWEQVTDNCTRETPNAHPGGVQHVFVKGVQVIRNGYKVKPQLKPA